MNLRLQEAAEKIAAQATLRAVRILARVLDSQLQRLRQSDDALSQALARIKELEARNGMLTEMIEAFQARLRKMNSKKRPHFTGPARFKALTLRHTMGWSLEEAAAQFVVTPMTFARWEHAADPARQTVGPDIRPNPPVRRYVDVVRSLVRLAERMNMGRAEQICAHIARGGWSISKSYVDDVLKSEPTEGELESIDLTPRMPLKAEFKGHVFILDSHEVKCLFGFRKFFLTGVMDAYSQASLGLVASETAPTAESSKNLLAHVIAKWGVPKYVAIDGGREFLGAFRDAASAVGAQIRLGSPGKTTITGLIERFWRTLDWLIGLPLNLPATIEELEERVSKAVAYYVYVRPIYALDGATPAERIAGVTPASSAAVQPPRGRPGVHRGPPPMVLNWLDPVGRQFPYFQAA